MNTNMLTQTIKIQRLKVLVLVLLTQSFCSHAKTDITRSGLTREAEQILDNVQSTSNDLFAIKREQVRKGPTKFVTLKTLQDQYPECDPLLSNVKRDDLGAKLQAWQLSIKQALDFINEHAFQDNTLVQASGAYRDAYLFFNTQVLEKYHDIVQNNDSLENAIRTAKQRVFSDAMQGEGKRMNHAREGLRKQFGKITFNWEDKNSTRVLILNLIDILNHNIHTVRKRVFELEKELTQP